MLAGSFHLLSQQLHWIKSWFCFVVFRLQRTCCRRPTFWCEIGWALRVGCSIFAPLVDYNHLDEIWYHWYTSLIFSLRQRLSYFGSILLEKVCEGPVWAGTILLLWTVPSALGLLSHVVAFRRDLWVLQSGLHICLLRMGLELGRAHLND